MVHASPEIGVTVRVEPDCVRIEVRDGSRVQPVRREGGPEARGGRGLVLLDAISRSWGVDCHGDGKSVWFELPRAHGRAARRPEPG